MNKSIEHTVSLICKDKYIVKYKHLFGIMFCSLRAAKVHNLTALASLSGENLLFIIKENPSLPEECHSRFKTALTRLKEHVQTHRDTVWVEKEAVQKYFRYKNYPGYFEICKYFLCVYIFFIFLIVCFCF